MHLESSLSSEDIVAFRKRALLQLSFEEARMCEAFGGREFYEGRLKPATEYGQRNMRDALLTLREHQKEPQEGKTWMGAEYVDVQASPPPYSIHLHPLHPHHPMLLFMSHMASARLQVGLEVRVTRSCCVQVTTETTTAKLDLMIVGVQGLKATKTIHPYCQVSRAKVLECSPESSHPVRRSGSPPSCGCLSSTPPSVHPRPPQPHSPDSSRTPSLSNSCDLTPRNRSC